VHNADAKIVKAAVEELAAVSPAVHPCLHHRLRRAAVRCAAADHLAEHVAAGAREVSTASDPGLDRTAARAIVGEVVAIDHVAAVALRGPTQAAVGMQRAEAVAVTQAVDQAKGCAA
jgi:hypothetical protein